MEKPLVSVVIPAHNCTGTIRQAIESARAQDVPLEILVIDDCSEDALAQELEAYRDDPRVIYIRNERNEGAAGSRNRGVRMARGEYVAFLDADDWWEKGKLSRQLARMKKEDCVLCCTARELVRPDGSLTGRVVPVRERITYRQLLRHNCINCSSVVVRTDVMRQFPMEHEDAHEDYIAWLKILQAYGKACAVNEPLLKYRLTGQGKSGTKQKSARMTFLVYRYMGFGFLKSVLCFASYAVHGVAKYGRAMLGQGPDIKFIAKQYLKMGVQNIFLPLVYRWYKRGPADQNLVVFADAHHREAPFSMRCMLEAVKKTDMRVITVFSDYGADSFGESLRQMIRFMKVYARAGFVVICDNFLPAASCKKRPETKVIQLWHACGALKKFGYDAKDDIPAYYRGNVQKNCDLVTVSSAFCVPCFAGAMGLPRERVLPLGVSRTDLYYREDFLRAARERFCRRYPKAAGKKVLLWAPTFRGNAARPQVCGEQAVDALAERLGDAWYVIKSLHPHLMRPKERTRALPAEELLASADLLITDYSSILFDYLIFRKPLVRFAPDLEEYRRQRGFYMDYAALPGTLVTEEDGLYDAVCREMEDFTAQKADQSFRVYMDACDGRATERILQWMEQKRQEGR